MLRPILLAIGVLLLAAAVLLLFAGGPPPVIVWLIVLGLALTMGILVERIQYKPLHGRRPDQGWVETGERFVDPETGRLVTVFHKPDTGERQYVDDGTGN